MFTGVITDLITPFNEKEGIMYKFFKSHLEFLKKNGVSGIICHGIYGEFPSLTLDEKLKILETVIENSNGLRIFPFLSDCSSENLLNSYKQIEEKTFDAIILGLPYFYPRIHEEGIIQFLTSFFKELKHPVLLANSPQYTGNKINIDVVEKLVGFDKFAGIVDYSGDTRLLQDIAFKFPQLTVLTGLDNYAVEGLKYGSKGLVSPLSNIFPKVIANLYNNYFGNQIQASEIQMRVRGLKSILSKFPTRSSIKYSMLQQGFPKISVRAPLRDLIESEKTVLKSKLTSYLIEYDLIDEE